MGWCRILTGLLLILQIALNYGASTGQCSGAKTCSECIKTHFTCKWCRDEIYDASRCQSDLNQELGSSECENWTFPKSVIEPDETEFGPIIQVKPSAIKITNLRPGEERNISVTVKSSKDYPLDVYYLMDFSYSMKEDLTKLKELTSNIIDNLKDISSNYSIGFGTFVDKPISPYAKTEPGQIEKPCELCQAVHSFNHEMSMTSGDGATEALKSRLSSLSISSNVDNPEGGFEAIVQAAVCSDDIGWRDPARKVIFFATDAVFHVAGDGKLAGIVEPNEGTCGMSNNKYTRSLNQDYPSIGQLNDVLIKNQVIPIFAVTAQMQNVYQELSEHLTQLSSVGKLSDNSDDVANLIKDQLESIVSSTQLNPQAPPGVTVTVIPKCAGAQTEMVNGQGCSNVTIDEEVSFSIVVKVAECLSEEEANSYNFNIEVPGIATIPISIDMICECPCEKDEDNIDKGSDKCNSAGDLICGACQCHAESYGKNCECNQTKDKSKDKCINPVSGAICGGDNNGKCICGQCECIQPSRDNYQRWGEFCECSNYECPRNEDNQICSNNGYCFCGDCDCNKTANGTPKQTTDPQFTGKDCGCPVSKEGCIHPETGIECSGSTNGECVCGECQCKPDHYGKYCDICQNCGPLNCTLYLDCVECVYEKFDDDKEAWRNCECDKSTVLSSDETVDTTKLGRHKQCEPIPYDDNCNLIYFLHYTDMGTTKQRILDEILIDRELDCPSQPDIIAIVAGVIGGILAVGILLLILWKIYTTIVDKREYTKFLEERSKAKWNTDNNPLYKNPVTHFQNPLSSRSPSFVYKEPANSPPPSSHPTSPTNSDTAFDFSRTSSSTNNQLPRRYNTGDFNDHKVSPVKNAAPVEEKIINSPKPPPVESPPDDISTSIDIASNIGEFDDILGDIQSTLSRDTIITNPSVAGGRLPPHPLPYSSPHRASPALPPRGTPDVSPRAALPPRAHNPHTLPLRRRDSREGQDGYLESNL
ncbi:integrin beta pat-3-like isoform X2 [Bolinopsis microptera]|uniref:integrin beta pat-3-like isoform X2 n=1 Tax=Bolinopsis microptera TaxID=2820187 RepID=UPI003078A81B